VIRESRPRERKREKLRRKRLGEEMSFEPGMEATVVPWDRLTAGLVSEDED